MGRKFGRALARAGAGGALGALLSLLAAASIAVGSRASSAPPTMAAAALTDMEVPLQAGATGAIDDQRAVNPPAPPAKTAPSKGTTARRPGPGPRPHAQTIRHVTAPVAPIQRSIPQLKVGTAAPKGVRVHPPVRAHAPLRVVKAPPRALPATYPPGSSGYDISRYQCSDIPARAVVAIVQVTGGALNGPPNSCYRREAAWAGANMSAYIFMDGLSGPAHLDAMAGPESWCAPTQRFCRGYNFGYNWARHWVAYSRRYGINPKLWWLDVENGARWTAPVINDGVISGAVRGLRSRGVNVGIYSTPEQWAAIAGRLTFRGVQIWTAGAGRLTGPGLTATTYCRSAGRYTFAGGHLAIVQWGYTGGFLGALPGIHPARYDYDYVCPRS